MLRIQYIGLALVLAISFPACTRDLNSDLIEAAKKGDTAAVQALLEAGGDIHTKDKEGYTPMLIAGVYGHKATVQALLAKGADKDIGGVSDFCLTRTPGHGAPFPGWRLRF